MLYWLCKKSGTLNSQQLEHSIKRNFGGAQNINPWKIFEESLSKDMYMPKAPVYSDLDDVRNSTLCTDANILCLVANFRRPVPQAPCCMHSMMLLILTVQTKYSS